MEKIIKNSKKYYTEKIRRTVDNKCFGKISLFLIDVLKPADLSAWAEIICALNEVKKNQEYQNVFDC